MSAFPAPSRSPPRFPALAARKAASKAQPAPGVFGYVRVSTDQQAEDGQSLDVQQRQLEGWAMQRGQQLEQVIVEPGISGSIPFNERPEGGKLWGELRKGDTLVAAKLDRVFRSAADCLAVVEAFKARGVSLFLLDLKGGTDDVSGNGIARLFLTIVSAFAEFERDRIGERIRQTKRAQKGRWEYLGGVVPFGFAKSPDGRSLIEDAVQQAAIRRIHELRASGLSSKRISAALAEDGIKLSHVSVLKIAERRIAA
jgi:putative DNA-invertase from lambdoid prophage Rac